MLIKQITVKNFLSFGNHPETIRLDGLVSTLVTGRNGSGKSSIYEAITFGLYGKALRNIKKADLVNKINRKDCLVIIEFDHKGHAYEIRRGISPAIFEILRDGVLVNQSSTVLDYQRVLETEIIGYDYDLFRQLIILNPNSYQSFFEMKASQRRGLLEELLGLQEVSLMNQVLQGHIAENRSQLTEFNTKSREIANQIRTLQSGIRSITEKIEEGSESLQTERDQLIAKRGELEKAVQKLSSDDLNSKMETIQTRLTSSETFTRKARDLLIELNSILNRNDREIGFLESHCECPTCHQEINEDHKSRIVLSLREESDGTLEKVKSVEDRMKVVADSHRETSEELSRLRETRAKIDRLLHAIQLVNRDIQNLQTRMDEHRDSDQVSFMRSQLDESVSRLTSTQETIGTLTERSNLLQSAKDFLSDDGIRRVVVSKYLPYIVSRINYWLEKMDYHAVVHIDDGFEETIKVRGFDPTKYSALSSGEKAKLSLSLVFAFREVLEVRNNSVVQLLIIDELLENMDSNSKVSLFWNLRGIAESTGTSIFIVSHAVTDNYDPFHRVLDVQKLGNFTKTSEIDP